MGLKHRVLRGAMKGVLRLVYPPQCLGCALPVATQNDGGGQLCPDCWGETRFISGTCCEFCGVPLPEGTGEAADEPLICDDCLIIPRPWDRGRAAFVYAGCGRDLVLALKHGDRPDLAPALAGWLSQAAAPLIRDAMIVAPVPIHLRRLLRRRYNQAGLISELVARRLGLQHSPDLLSRIRHSPPQDHRGFEERFNNVAGSIAVTARRRKILQGQPVLLVDDVMASGATLAMAAKALLAAGSGPISVAVLARAVKDH
jgi:predicted amidophosphoribosyltransferase